jgi:hypothetical protein
MYTYCAESLASRRTAVAAFICLLLSYVVVLELVSAHCPQYRHLVVPGFTGAFIALSWFLHRRVTRDPSLLEIRVDDSGVYSRAWSDKPIAWHNIARAESRTQATTAGTHRFCVLTLNNPSLDPPRQQARPFAIWASLAKRDKVVLAVDGATEFDHLVQAIGQRRPEVLDTRSNALASVLVSVAWLLSMLSWS